MVKFNTQTYVLAGIIVLLGLVVVYLVFFRNQTKEGLELQKGPPQQQPSPGPEGPSQKQIRPDVPTLIFFHADWCKYCQDFKPVWAQIEAFLHDKIQVLDLESKVPVTAKLHRGAWPTLKFYPKGIAAQDSAMEYKGDRSNPQNIINFVASFMQPPPGNPPQPQQG